MNTAELRPRRNHTRLGVSTGYRADTEWCILYWNPELQKVVGKARARARRRRCVRVGVLVDGGGGGYTVFIELIVLCKISVEVVVHHVLLELCIDSCFVVLLQ